jgi:acylpyruvate hydrolase
VTADALPPGYHGLRLETRLTGQVVQNALIDDLIFDFATLVSLLSEAMTLAPGDVIVTGTPPLWMRPGDVCEVEVESIGILIADEPR